MKYFILFYNQKECSLVEASKISGEEVNALLNKGFVKVDIKATDKKEAIRNAQSIANIKTGSLKEFGEDVSFSAIIESLLR
jgi:hypothetical protein